VLTCPFASVSQADLAALWQLVEAVLRWRTEAAALAAATFEEAAQIPAAQTAILVEAGLKCNLQHITQVGANPTLPNGLSASNIAKRVETSPLVPFRFLACFSWSQAVCWPVQRLMQGE
jgi:hypothetical protein